MLKWLIIGGGIQGTYLSHLLVQRLEIPAERLGVLDPAPRPLAVWRRRSFNCGMTHLRSPATHNIDLGIMSLHHFVRARGGPRAQDFIPPYYRPSLSVFNAHCERVIADNGLAALRVKGRALGALPVKGGLTVETTEGPIATERILLATGSDDVICTPTWARRLREAGAAVRHLFDADFDRRRVRGEDTEVVVVGGGISAAQCVLALADQVRRPVTLLSRHPLTESQFDFDPCWIGPKCLTDFYRQPYCERRSIVDAARLPGTLPGEVLEQLRTAVAAGRVVVHTGEPEAARCAGGGIQLALAGTQLRADLLVLATGFTRRRPGGALVDGLIERFRLPVTAEGYPVIGHDLRWHRHIYVSGGLAELQVGPCARNIVGVRNAGRLLVEGLRSG